MAMKNLIPPAFLLSLLLSEGGSVDYGVDISMPMHHAVVSTNYPWLPHNLDPANVATPDEYKDMPIQPLGNRQQFYEDFMKGCFEYYSEEQCLEAEETRIAVNMRRPQSVRNYTDVGFQKIKTPKPLWDLLDKFWQDNKHRMFDFEEPTTGYRLTDINYWVNSTYMLNVHNQALLRDEDLGRALWDAAENTISNWTGQDLKPASLYGIRLYQEGAILSPHADKIPLVSSAIINVAQDVDEPWPLEVIGHDGKAHNVTMEPGDMVLYESHSILHGRPFPLKGRYMANIFIHFEPREEVRDGLPSYFVPGSPEANEWLEENLPSSPLPSTQDDEEDEDEEDDESEGDFEDDDDLHVVFLEKENRSLKQQIKHLQEALAEYERKQVMFDGKVGALEQEILTEL